MFGASSELAIVMEFGFKCVRVGLIKIFMSLAKHNITIHSRSTP